MQHLIISFIFFDKYFEDYIVPMPILGDGQAAATEKDIAAPEYNIAMFSNGTLEASAMNVGGVANAILRIITPSNKRVLQKFTVEKIGSSFSFHATCTDSAEGFAWKVFPKNCNKLGIGWRRKYVMTAPPNASYWGTDISELFKDQFSPSFYSSGFTNYYLSFNVKNQEVFEGVEFVVLFGDKGYLESLDYNQYQNSKSNQAAFVTCIPIGTSNSYEEYPELIVQYDDSFWNDLIKISAYVPSLGSGTVDIAVSFTNGNNESYWPGRIFYNNQPQTIILPGSAGNQIPIIDLDTTNIFIQNKFPYRVTIYAKNGIKVTSNYIENLFLIRPGMYYTNNYFLFDPTRIKITSGSSYEYFRFIGNQINPDSPLNAESFNLQFNDIDYGTAIEDRKFSIYLFNATNSMPMHPSSYYLHSSSKEWFSEKYNTGSDGRIDMQLSLIQDVAGMHKVGNLYTLAIVYNENGLCYSNVLPMADWFAVYDKVMLDILKEYCDNSGIRDCRPQPRPSAPNTELSLVENAVCYSYGCKDTINNYNNDINDANSYLSNYPPVKWKYYTNISYMPRLYKEQLEQWVSQYYPYKWAGIDCSGFVQRGARNHQFLTTLNRVLPETRSLYGWTLANYNSQIDSYTISASDFRDNRNITDIITDRNLLVPGDLIVTTDHVTAIWRIDCTQRKRGAWAKEDIVLIEASSPENKVIKDETTWGDDLSAGVSRRLKE